MGPDTLSEILVEVDHLRKVYDPYAWMMRMLVRTAVKEPVVAVDDLSFTVRAGEIGAIVGPNGAGKSTLFRVLTGLTTPTAGRATILGADVATDAKAVRRLVGFMPAENRTLFLRFTAVENLVFHGRLQGMSEARIRIRTDEVLEMVGLTYAAERAVDVMSSGMKARLQLARAIMHEPPVLILDEPTGAVDPIASKELLDIIQAYAQSNQAAVLLSSHRLEEIEALDDNVVLLDRGRLVYWGALDQLRALWERPRIEITFDSWAARAAARERLLASGAEVDESKDLGLAVTASVPVGVVLGRLGEHLASVVSVEQSRMPLRDLLGRLLEERRVQDCPSDGRPLADTPAAGSAR